MTPITLDPPARGAPLSDARYVSELRRALVVHHDGPALTCPTQRAAAWAEMRRHRACATVVPFPGGSAA